MKLSLIAKEIDIEFSGDDCEINALNTLSNAISSELSFLDNAKYEHTLKDTKAAAVLVHPNQAHLVPAGTVALVTPEPYLKLALTSKLFAPVVLEKSGEQPQVGKNTVIAPNVYLGFGSVIGDNVTIMPGSFVGDNVTIDSDTTIHPNVTIYRDCKVGKECIIHASTVIGSDGFGFAHTKTGEHIKIYQNGNVVIEDDVEIGGNTSIDRAVFGTTLIKKGTKMDNLIQIAHNVEIGEYTIITGQVGIAGSSKIGHHSIFGAQSGQSGHVTIAPFTTVAARCGVISDITESSKTWAGFPHQPHREWLRTQAKVQGLIKKKKS